jgi:hypothetical protein
MSGCSSPAGRVAVSSRRIVIRGGMTHVCPRARGACVAGEVATAYWGTALTGCESSERVSSETTLLTRRDAHRTAPRGATSTAETPLA